MQLSDLVFSDLCVAESLEDSWYKATPDSMITQLIPAECVEELGRFRDHLLEHGGRSSTFKVEWPPLDDTSQIENPNELMLRRMRVERIGVYGGAQGATVYICRRYRISPGPLASLGMPDPVAKKLMDASLSAGLIVFFGKTGSGKTTTAASCVTERLASFGGVCWTVENPIEIPMQGRYGPGVCYQTEVSSDEDIGEAIRRLYRATPNIIFLGELRDRSAVREALSASTSGHLVITTSHAPDLITGLSRLVQMAENNTASVTLADALQVAVHLELHTLGGGMPLPDSLLSVDGTKGTGTPPRVLSVEPLWVPGIAADAVKSMLRDGGFHLLRSEVDRQKRAFMQSRLP
jgi:twitching motility protein PilT